LLTRFRYAQTREQGEGIGCTSILTLGIFSLFLPNDMPQKHKKNTLTILAGMVNDY
jgi:hypothetical protein